MFENIEAPCCMGQPKYCLCGPDERVLRAYADGVRTEPMAPEEREWCLEEADHAGEGSYPREEGMRLSDRELARWVLRAWNSYVQANCL